MLTVLEKTPFGFTLEIESRAAYYYELPYTIFVNGAKYGEDNRNIFSIFGLLPDTVYEIKLVFDAGSGDGICKGSEPPETLAVRLCTKAAGYVLDIRDYNAKGDGVSNDTASLNTALYLAPKGSVVRIPAGIYLVDQILLKSDVDIYMEEGSILLHNPDRTSLSVMKGFQRDYEYDEATVYASWEGNPLDTYCGVFLGYQVKNIRIYGKGIIDGNGDKGNWWLSPKVKNIAYRPKNMFLNHCSDISVIGITSRNSACWNIHPFYCDHVRFIDMKLCSLKTSPNTDGINPESCKDVVIAGCNFDVGDDCIAIKSGKYFMSRFDYRPCEDLHIYHCYMGSGHGGIALGSEISSGVRKLLVERCLMEGTDRGIRIKTRRGRGERSVVEDITLKDISMKGVGHGIAVNMFYNCDPDGKSDYVKDKKATTKDEYTPRIQNVMIEGIKALDVRGCGIFMYGLPESKITGVTIQTSVFSFADQRTGGQPEMLEDFEEIKDLGIFIKNCEDLRLTDNSFYGSYASVIDQEEEALHERNT